MNTPNLFIHGYNINEEIGQKGDIHVFRSIRQTDGKQVILKVVYEKNLTPKAYAILRHEYKLLSDIKILGVISPVSFENHHDTIVFVYEDPIGNFLSDTIKSGLHLAAGLSLKDFLCLALSMANNIAQVHHQKIIHKDINPYNFLINPNTFQSHLTGFYQASKLRREESEDLTGMAEESLSYISPERTGRMNRSVDLRSDLYSFGVTLYELSTGLLPFDVSDRLELIHFIMAKRPLAPYEINPSLPLVISEMIVKLMDKEAERRYQTIFGLISDLEECYRRLEQKGWVDDFVIGNFDFQNKLNIPEKLYGRNRELNLLTERFDNACKGDKKLVLISGEAGIGKTSIVNEVYKLKSVQNGFFLSGKFNKLRRSIPYSGVVDALRSLVKQILESSPDRLAFWKEKIVTALGANGRLIVDVIPELETITGHLPPMEKLESIESKNRFVYTFIKFTRIFGKANHLLVVFLDDLQWADTETFKLINSIITDDAVKSFLLVGAYRQEEISHSHPLNETLEAVQANGIPIDQVQLKPLDFGDITQLIADTLKLKKSQVKLLSNTVMQKTNRNPFFVTCFLNTLLQEGLLKFGSEKKRWRWDLEKIKKVGVTENVVDLLINSLNRLPTETLNIIQIGACIGIRFDIHSLNMFMKEDQNKILENILPAVESGLLISSSTYDVKDEKTNHHEIVSFKFLHDRIHQAVFEMIDQDRIKEIHLQLGRNKIKNSVGKEVENEIFDIVHHLNISAKIIQNEEERYQAAEFNKIASRIGMHSAAFKQAFQFAKAGLAFLGPKAWKTHYNLTLSLHTKALQTAYPNADLQEIETIFKHVKKNSENLLDQVGAYKSLIQAYLAQNQFQKAVKAGFDILELLGCDFSNHTDLSDTQIAFEKTRSLLKSKTAEDLIQMPTMTDPNKTAILKLLADICVPVYFFRPELLPLMVFRAIKLSVIYGNLPESCFIYSVYGLLLTGLYADIDSGYQFGKIGLELAEKKANKEFQCKTIEIFNVHIRHNKKHIRETLDSLIIGYQSGVESGDLPFANFCVFNRCSHAYLMGQDLGWVEKEMEEFSQVIKQHKQVTVLNFHSIFQQSVLNLRQKKGDAHLLLGDVYDEHLMLVRHQQTNDRHALFYFYFNKMVLCYLFEEFDLAFEYSQQAENYIDGAIAMFNVPVFYFYDSLIRLACYPNASGDEKKKIIQKISINQDKMKVYSDSAPMNHRHKYLLVEAERLRVIGLDLEAFENYDLAISTAHKNGYMNEEALSLELTALFWLNKGNNMLANFYIQKAWYCYRKWGAFQKVRQIEKKYSKLIQGPKAFFNLRDREISNSENAFRYRQGGIDLRTVIKASQAVSSGMHIEELINVYMKTLMEGVGAQKSALIIKSDSVWRVEVYNTLEQKILATRPGVAVEDFADISREIVDYVIRTGESVVLDDAWHEEKFSQDLYIRGENSKSILCMPIIYKTESMGIIYLENNLVSGVFTRERLSVIKIIAIHIAISIENANLYSNLRKTEKKYRDIFEKAVEGIFQTSPEGKFITVNPAAAQLLGYDSPKDLMESVKDIGKQIYSLKEDREQFLELFKEKQTVAGIEVKFRQKDGSLIWVSLHARRVNKQNGDIKLIEGTFIDITKRKEAEEALIGREEYFRKENVRLRSNIKDRYKFANIVGKSEAMQEVYEIILKAAATNAPIMISGESGTGKELTARAIHEMSDRRNDEFVPVNCGAIPENLLESEFFGYKKGAFTGADSNKDGFLDIADKGSLFLDELGEISLNLQVKLLRAIEGGGFTPLGGKKLKKPDLRIIAATNLDLEKQIRKGLMREDFYYRVNIIPIRMPPLRERKEDIPLLIEHFWNASGYEKTRPPLPAHIISHLINYKWPGNVRELQNILHRYAALNRLDFECSSESEIEQAVPELDIKNIGFPLNSAVAEFEKKYIGFLLEKHQWRRKQVASILKIGRRTLYTKIKAYGLESTRNG